MRKLLLFTGTIFVSFWFDDFFIQVAHVLTGTKIGVILLSLTDAGVITYVFITLYFFFIERKFHAIALALFGIIASLEAGFFIKMLTQVPRPYAGDAVSTTLGLASGFSFPSNHAAVVFCLYAFTRFLFTKEKKWFFVVTAFFALTRALVGVHYFSDVVGGSVIGFAIGNCIIKQNGKNGIIEKMIATIKDKLELRRQIAHIITGFAIIFLVRANILSLEGLLIILIIGGILSYTMRTRDVPIATPILKWFEREKYIKNFPGRGSFFFVLGSFLALLFFERQNAFAAIAIMAIGDAVNNIVGTYFGKIKIFYNTKKHVEGLLVAILAGTIAAVNFVPFFPALAATTLAMIIETIPFQLGKHEIDDNIIIPLVAGGVISLLTKF